MPVPSVLLNAFGNAGSHTIEWSECVWELELSVLTWNKSRLWRCRTCFGPFSLYFLWSTWLHYCLSLSLSSEMWKLGNRPTTSNMWMSECAGVMGDLDVWWGWWRCREEGRAAKLAAVCSSAFWLLIKFQVWPRDPQSRDCYYKIQGE